MRKITIIMTCLFAAGCGAAPWRDTDARLQRDVDVKVKQAIQDYRLDELRAHQTVRESILK